MGHILARHFCAQGHSVIVLSRSSSPEVSNCASWQLLPWDGDTQGNWTSSLEGADVCINLAGRSVDCRYNRKNRKAIYDSRVRTTILLNEVLATLKAPPPLWINASTATIYRHTLDRDMDEATGELGGTNLALPTRGGFPSM